MAEILPMGQDSTTGQQLTYSTGDTLKSITDIAGQVNGLATLDSNGKLPSSQIPTTLVGAVVYKGTWNATTNSPTLASGAGTQGNYYVVNVAGSTNLDGITSWNIGDIAIFNGTIWEKIDNTDAVLSVFGRTGAVVSANGDYTASQITNVAAGNISAVTVQAAINELDTEKEALANKDASGGYAGLTLFKINFKNVANTSTSFFTNSNTAARTYTFQNRDGTIADDTDLAGKQDIAVARSHTSQSLAINTARTPNVNKDVEVTITFNLDSDDGDTSTAIVQVDNSGGGTFVTIATVESIFNVSGVLGVTGSIVEKKTCTFTCPKGSQYKWNNTGTSGGTVTVASIYELIMG